MINYENIEYDMFGDVVLGEGITCSKETLEKMVNEPSKRTPEWEKIINNLVAKDIVEEM